MRIKTESTFEESTKVEEPPEVCGIEESPAIKVLKEEPHQTLPYPADSSDSDEDSKDEGFKPNARSKKDG